MSEQSNTISWWLGVLAVVVGGSILGVGAMVWSKLDRVETNVAESSRVQTGIQKDVEWLKLSMTDIYTGNEADNAHAQIQQTTNDLYGRWKNLDERVSTLERNAPR